MLKWLYDKLYPKKDVEAPSTTVTRAEAKRAVRRANIGYRTALRREPAVTQAVSNLRIQSERNHFGDLIEKTMRGNG